MYSVYTLIDPRDNLIHYVGISKDPQQRFQEHLRKDHNWLKSAWIHELKELGFLPSMRVIAENLTYEEAQKSEYQLIQHYHKSGLPMKNLDGITREYGYRVIAGKKESPWPDPVIGIKIEEMLTIHEVVPLLKYTPYYIRELCKKGELRAVRIGGHWRIKQEDLRAFVDRRFPQQDKK